MRKKTDLYLDVRSSVIRFINQKIAYFIESGFIEGAVYVDLDAHADLAEMPDVDCICLQGFQASLDEKFITIGFNIGVSTFNDAEKVKHNRLVSELLGSLAPTETIPLVTHDKGEEIGSLIINEDTEVAPFAKTNVRSIQFILVTALSTETVFA